MSLRALLEYNKNANDVVREHSEEQIQEIRMESSQIHPEVKLASVNICSNEKHVAVTGALASFHPQSVASVDSYRSALPEDKKAEFSGRERGEFRRFLENGSLELQNRTSGGRTLMTSDSCFDCNLTLTLSSRCCERCLC